jgi:asparagine synthetase B (glutamine-hydrolysing)
MRKTEAAKAKAAMRSVADSLVEKQLASGTLRDDAELEELSTIRHINDPATLYVVLNSSDVIGDIETYETRIFDERLSTGSDPAETIRSRWNPSEGSLCEQALEWDFTVKLPDDFLHVEDRMSMAHSLESRVPFLDNELIDLAFSIPFSRKFAGTGSEPVDRDIGKQILQEAMSDLLPDAVFAKDKQGFTMPTHEFVRAELLDYAERILDSPVIVDEGLVQKEYISSLLRKGPQERLTHHHKVLWKVVALEIWYQMYIAGNEVTPPQSIDAYCA